MVKTVKKNGFFTFFMYYFAHFPPKKQPLRTVPAFCAQAKSRLPAGVSSTFLPPFSIDGRRFLVV
ncbi:hypothetical protein D5272_08560 [bacterium D16-76]|nr:hypothetical protein [bacterium D16-76]